MKKVKKQNVKETTEESEKEEEQQSDEECAEPGKVSENGNDDKEGSTKEDDSDEDGPQLPSGLTGKHGTTCNMINTAICGEPSLPLVIHSFKWGKKIRGVFLGEAFQKVFFFDQ